MAWLFEARGLHPVLASRNGERTGDCRRGESLCFARPTGYDILVEGAKVAGGAQRATRDGLLHQGSILAGGQWRVAPDELWRAWESFGARFTSLHLAVDEVAAISGLASAKYATSAWNQRVSGGRMIAGSDVRDARPEWRTRRPATMVKDQLPPRPHPE